MAYKFRTTGPWGPGTSVDLDPVDVDNNFWQAIQDIAEKSTQGVGIADVIVTGNQFSFVLTDHTVLGPYTLPMMEISFGGEWAPNTFYAAGKIITHGGSTYFVEQNHTSDTTFDPGANDGFGHDFYGLLLTNASLTLPTGGPAGWVLAKASDADYALQWQAPNVNATVITVETVTGSTINPLLPDIGKYFRCASGSGTLVTLPLNSSVAFPIGTELKFRQDTIFGVVEITGVTGVVINTIEGFLATTAKQGAVIEAIKVDINVWDVWNVRFQEWCLHVR
jgi:hypothetical protein